ncbi:MAG: hypothetical protein CME60_12220 [Halobacteriovoraceae bacterium]|nr:hypothetical protein [Halobacteriovoraceae bacterium]
MTFFSFFLKNLIFFINESDRDPMKNRTIKQQVLILSGVMLFVQVTLAGIGYYSLTSINQKLNSVFSTRLPSINYLVQADRDFQQMLVAERSLLLNGLSSKERKAQMGDYLKNKGQVLERFNKYKALDKTPEELKLVEAFESRYQRWEKDSVTDFIFNEKGDFLLNDDNRERLTQKSFGSMYSHFESSRDQMDQLQELILNFGAQEFQDAQKTYTLVNNLIIGISVGGILLSLLLGYLFSKAINFKISSIVELMTSEGENLGGISHELDTRSIDMRDVSSSLSSATTETTSSMEEITQMIKNNTEGANRVSHLVEQSKGLIHNSVGYLEKLSSRIQDVESSSLNLSNTIQKSNDELSEIIRVFNEVNEKTKVINDIVFQTKLLSFNASVEAARSGENGKGFAVVAEEVGNLARISGESAEQITKLLEKSLTKVTEIVSNSKEKINSSISENQKYVQESVELGNQCKEVILKVSSDFNEVASTSNQVSEASREQLVGVQEVNQAMQNISGSAASTNDAAGKINNSSKKVEEAVYRISKSIIDLRTLVERVDHKNDKQPPSNSKEEKNIQMESVDNFEKEPYSDVA